MATSTSATPAAFFLFTELPLELQMEIFSLAAVGPKPAILMFDILIIWTSNDFPNPSNKPLFRQLIKFGLEHGYWTRTRMLRVCRLSRLMALETWKKDLRGMAIETGKNDYIDRNMGNSRRGMREKLLGEIEVLIGMIRGSNQGGEEDALYS